MIDFTQVFEDGDYQVFKSTNHADPDRIALIIADHGINEYARYAALVEDQYEEEVDETARAFFRTFEEAKRYLECEVVHTIKLRKAC